MVYPRKLFVSLKKHLKQPQVTVITGMRRVGKTTLVKQLLDESTTNNKHYFDLERVDNRELFSEKNFDNIIISFERLGLSVGKRLVIALDEIQLLPQITGVIKYLYDKYKIKFIVTGSSSYYLKNLFRESLSGRKKIFELYPLDFGEYLVFKEKPYRNLTFNSIIFNPTEYENLKNEYELFIRFGGFPEVVLTKETAGKMDLLRDIISSYMNIDIKSLTDLQNERSLYSLIKLLAARSATRLDYSKLSRLTGISRPTVTSYIDLLDKTYIIRRLPVHSANIDRQIVKAEKIYFTDTGLLNALAEVSSGIQFENAVANQLSLRGQLAYWSDKSGHEIDFIYNKRLGLETKEMPILDDYTKLHRLSRLIGIKKYFIIGRNPTPSFRRFIWAGSIQ